MAVIIGSLLFSLAALGVAWVATNEKTNRQINKRLADKALGYVLAGVSAAFLTTFYIPTL